MVGVSVAPGNAGRKFLTLEFSRTPVWLPALSLVFPTFEVCLTTVLALYLFDL